MKVYVSGPITGVANYRKIFADATDALVEEGYHVVNPCTTLACPDSTCTESATSVNPVHNGHTWSCWLKYDLIDMLTCDAVVVLPGWLESRGAVLEVTTARAVHIPVYGLDELTA